MTHIINAVFENGVFKPLQKVDIKEHEKVTIKILDLDDWQMRFNQIIERIHQKTRQFPSEEIESDITQAIKEVKEEKIGF